MKYLACIMFNQNGETMCLKLTETKKIGLEFRHIIYIWNDISHVIDVYLNASLCSYFQCSFIAKLDSLIESFFMDFSEPELISSHMVTASRVKKPVFHLTKLDYLFICNQSNLLFVFHCFSKSCIMNLLMCSRTLILIMTKLVTLKALNKHFVKKLSSTASSTSVTAS